MQGMFNTQKSINVIYYINKRKDKKYMILSVHAEEACDKVLHSFLIIALKKVGIYGTYLNIIKDIYERSTANIILIVDKLRTFPLWSGTK